MLLNQETDFDDEVAYTLNFWCFLKRETFISIRKPHTSRNNYIIA